MINNNKTMEKKKTGLREQEAPEKNTDRAFVKVARDSSPDMPGRDKKNPAPSKKEEEKKPRK
jgi:hypothetical protein